MTCCEVVLLDYRPPAPVRVPSQRPLAPSVAWATSVANDKGGNEMILGAVHRFPGICLTAEENPRKPQLGDRVTKGCATSHRLKWAPFPPNEDSTACQEGRRKEGRRKKGRDGYHMYWVISCVYTHIQAYSAYILWGSRQLRAAYRFPNAEDDHLLQLIFYIQYFIAISWAHFIKTIRTNYKANERQWSGTRIRKTRIWRHN